MGQDSEPEGGGLDVWDQIVDLAQLDAMDRGIPIHLVPLEAVHTLLEVAAAHAGDLSRIAFLKRASLAFDSYHLGDGDGNDGGVAGGPPSSSLGHQLLEAPATPQRVVEPQAPDAEARLVLETWLRHSGRTLPDGTRVSRNGTLSPTLLAMLRVAGVLELLDPRFRREGPKAKPALSFGKWVGFNLKDRLFEIEGQSWKVVEKLPRRREGTAWSLLLVEAEDQRGL